MQMPRKMLFTTCAIRKFHCACLQQYILHHSMKLRVFGLEAVVTELFILVVDVLQFCLRKPGSKLLQDLNMTLGNVNVGERFSDEIETKGVFTQYRLVFVGVFGGRELEEKSTPLIIP